MKEECQKCNKVTRHNAKPSGDFKETGIDRALVALFTLGISEASRELKLCCEECGSENTRTNN